MNVSGPLPWIGATVDRALALGRAHAVLLHGAAGDGLFECAQAIVQAWLCETSSSARACSRCGAARSACRDCIDTAWSSRCMKLR